MAALMDDEVVNLTTLRSMKLWNKFDDKYIDHKLFLLIFPEVGP